MKLTLKFLIFKFEFDFVKKKNLSKVKIYYPYFSFIQRIIKQLSMSRTVFTLGPSLRNSSIVSARPFVYIHLNWRFRFPGDNKYYRLCFLTYHFLLTLYCSLVLVCQDRGPRKCFLPARENRVAARVRQQSDSGSLQ